MTKRDNRYTYVAIRTAKADGSTAKADGSTVYRVYCESHYVTEIAAHTDLLALVRERHPGRLTATWGIPEHEYWCAAYDK